MKIRSVVVALMHGGRTDLHDEWACIFLRSRTCVKNAKVEGVCLETLVHYVNCCVF